MLPTYPRYVLYLPDTSNLNAELHRETGTRARELTRRRFVFLRCTVQYHDIHRRRGGLVYCCMV